MQERIITPAGATMLVAAMYNVKDLIRLSHASKNDNVAMFNSVL